MKLFKYLAVVMALIATVPASAQFVGGSSRSRVSTNSGDNENYSRFSLGYNAAIMSPKGGGESTTLSGATVGYTRGISIGGNPLFVEFGGRLNYNSGKYKTSLMSLGVPVSLAYKFNIADGISIAPYTGINFKVNIIGKQAGINMFSSGGDYDDDYDYDYYGYSYDDDYDDYDYDEDDWKWKRFQMGWHIGAGVNINKFYVGVEYGLDFIKLQKYINTSSLSVTVGVNF